MHFWSIHVQGFIGVSRYKTSNRYEAHIWLSASQMTDEAAKAGGGTGGVGGGKAASKRGRQLHLGSFAEAATAAEVYDRAAFYIRGSTADLNFPEVDYSEDPIVKELAPLGLPSEEFCKRMRGEMKKIKAQAQGTAARSERAAAGAAGAKGADGGGTAAAAGSRKRAGSGDPERGRERDSSPDAEAVRTLAKLRRSAAPLVGLGLAAGPVEAKEGVRTRRSAAAAAERKSSASPSPAPHGSRAYDSRSDVRSVDEGAMEVDEPKTVPAAAALAAAAPMTRARAASKRRGESSTTPGLEERARARGGGSGSGLGRGAGAPAGPIESSSTLSRPTPGTFLFPLFPPLAALGRPPSGPAAPPLVPQQLSQSPPKPEGLAAASIQAPGQGQTSSALMTPPRSMSSAFVGLLPFSGFGFGTPLGFGTLGTPLGLHSPGAMGPPPPPGPGSALLVNASAPAGGGPGPGAGGGSGLLGSGSTGPGGGTAAAIAIASGPGAAGGGAQAQAPSQFFSSGAASSPPMNIHIPSSGWPWGMYGNGHGTMSPFGFGSLNFSGAPSPMMMGPSPRGFGSGAQSMGALGLGNVASSFEDREQLNFRGPIFQSGDFEDVETAEIFSAAATAARGRGLTKGGSRSGSGAALFAQPLGSGLGPSGSPDRGREPAGPAPVATVGLGLATGSGTGIASQTQGPASPTPAVP